MNEPHLPPLPNRFSRYRMIMKAVLLFWYSLIFFIFGWPNLRISSSWTHEGTRYSEYVGLGGFEYLVYPNNQKHPPLFVLLPLMKNLPEFKHDDTSYEIRQEQPK